MIKLTKTNKEMIREAAGKLIRISTLLIFLLSGSALIQAQVKITDGSLLAVDSNAILELESSDKGLLIPRVTIPDPDQEAPMSAPLSKGMLVYNTGGILAEGFYYWNGTRWTRLSGTDINSLIMLKISADDTLIRENSVVSASNNIMLTLPSITPSDAGLRITVKNTGSFTDLIRVRGNGPAMIDDFTEVAVIPRNDMTFVASGSDWLVENRDALSNSVLEVGINQTFPTIYDALDFLGQHMEQPMVVRLNGTEELIDETIVIDLPYPLTIQGLSYGATSLEAAPGLSGKPMFRCLSESYFKMLVFDATTLAGYGTSDGEDCVRLAGSGTYHEIKDCTFDGFYNTIVDSSDAELWLFECDITNASNNGLLVRSPVPGTKIRVSETDFISCNTGVNLDEGSSTDIHMMSGVFENLEGGNSIIYNPATFSFNSLILSNNSWNHAGNDISGFDFTRPDGRDANAYIENNPGMKSNAPHCNISVTNNLSTVTCTAANTWYKADWINTAEETTNIRIENNKITYLPDTKRDMTIFISGNVKVSSINRVITISIVKNGNPSVRYGETALRITTANQPFQFSTVVYIEDVTEDDYFEMYCSSANAGDVLTFQDINWYVSSEK
jgi:hypothetical protein